MYIKQQPIVVVLYVLTNIVLSVLDHLVELDMTSFDNLNITFAYLTITFAYPKAI